MSGHRNWKEIQEELSVRRQLKEAQERESPRTVGRRERIEEPYSIIDFDIVDSGQREIHDTGAVRDTEDGKIDWTNLFVFFEPMGTRYAEHLTKGRAKYEDIDGEPNWKRFPATPDMFRRYRRSFLRHVKAYLEGKQDEDHAAAIIFNLNGMEDVRKRMSE